MNLQKEAVIPILGEINQIFDMFLETLVVDQWIREMTTLSFVMIVVLDNSCFLWYFQKEVEEKYSICEKEIEKKIAIKSNYSEEVQNFLDNKEDKYGQKKYLMRYTDLEHLNQYEVYLICVCKSPTIEGNIDKLLFSNSFYKLVDGLGEWFIKIGLCNKSVDDNLLMEHIDYRNEYVSNKLEYAALDTQRMLEKMYFPIRLPYINELSGEYYEKSECNSTLVFLPIYEEKDVDLGTLEFNFREENIFFIPKEFRRIRKLMQIAQKELHLLFEYVQNVKSYRVLGVCRNSKIKKFFKVGNNIPWINATIKRHMQWELKIDDRHIFSFKNGNYKISGEMSSDYLKQKCIQVFQKKCKYQKVIKYVQTSCKQSHGTMLIVLSDKHAETEARRFTEGQYGMRNDSTINTSGIDINAFNAIDGSVILDQRGSIHAIGAILDGAIQSKGNMARGARYNSAVKYRDSLLERGIPGIILIVSEDGSVEILDAHQPQKKQQRRKH